MKTIIEEIVAIAFRRMVEQGYRFAAGAEEAAVRSGMAVHDPMDSQRTRIKTIEAIQRSLFHAKL